MVAALLVVEAAELEATVPFLVPVTNSICENAQDVRRLISFSWLCWM